MIIETHEGQNVPTPEEIARRTAQQAAAEKQADGGKEGEKPEAETPSDSQTEIPPEERAEKASEQIDALLGKNGEEETLEKTSESSGDLNKPVEPENILKDLEAGIEHNQAEIARLTTAIETQKKGLSEARKALGLPDQQEQTPEETELQELLADQKNLEEKKEEAEQMSKLEEVLQNLGKLSPEQIVIVIQTGKIEGKELQTKTGEKVDTKVAQELGKAAQRGEKKLTKAILRATIDITKSILKAIFSVVSAAVEGNEKN